MAKYNFFAIVDGKQQYNFRPITTRETPETLCKRLAFYYYDSLCAVHNYGRLDCFALNTETGESSKYTLFLNKSRSAAVYSNFRGVELPPVVDCANMSAGAR